MSEKGIVQRRVHAEREKEEGAKDIPSPLQMRVVPKNTHHVRVGSLAAAPGLLGLLLLHLGPRFDHLVLVGRRDAGFLQLLLDILRPRDLDLIPDLLELVIEVLHQRGIICPHHLGVVIFLVPSHEQLPFLLHLVDRFLNIRPPLSKITDTHPRRGRLRLQVLQQLLGSADVVRGTKAEGTLAVGAARIEIDFLVHLENAPEGVDVPRVVFAVLQGEVRDDIVELERHALGFHVFDRKKDLRHDIPSRARVGWLRIDDVDIVALLLNFAGGRRSRRRRRDLRAAGRGVVDHSPLLGHAVRRLHHASVEALQLVL